jgi:hypothetical protein
MKTSHLPVEYRESTSLASILYITNSKQIQIGTTRRRRSGVKKAYKRHNILQESGSSLETELKSLYLPT